MTCHSHPTIWTQGHGRSVQVRSTSSVAQTQNKRSAIRVK